MKEHIEKKILENFNCSRLEVIDNSHLHTKHKSFNPNKYHLKIVIKSTKLREMNKIDSHRLIFSVLGEEMKKKIHALEIEVK